MTFTITYSDILDDIRYEVARVSVTATTQGDKQEPAFDSIDIKSSDERMIKEFVYDALQTIVTRFTDCASLTYTDDYISKIEFNVPDFETSKENAVKRGIERYVMFDSCSCWFDRRYKSVVESYNNMSKSEMDSLVTLIRTRKDV